MIEISKAEAILAEASSYGVVDALPDNPKYKIKAAEELLNYAQVQYNQFHNREPSIMAIIFAGTDGQEEAVEEKSSSEEKEKDDDPLSTRLGNDEEVPEEVEESALDLVVDDFTSLSDGELRRLHSKFNSMASHYAFKLMHEENQAIDCKLVADQREDKLIRPLMDGKKSKTLLQSQVSDDKELKLWRGRQQQHERNLRRFKTEFDVSISNVERISREWSMRSKERDSSGVLPFTQK